MIKVALTQNRIQPGGRFQVMAEMISVLNDRGLVPDIVCFRSKLDSDKVKEFYGKSLKFNLRLLKPEPPLPFEWNIYYFNKVLSRVSEEYDLIINHNNSSFGLQAACKVISYIHFPRKARLGSGLKDIHFPEKGKTPILNLKKDLLNLMASKYRKQDDNFGQSEVLIANSDFTREQLLKSYPSLRAERVQVLYPPVNVGETMEPLGSKDQLVSLGRIAPAKRQLEQLKIVSSVSGLKFKIIGFVADDAYHEECQAYLNEQGMDQAQILANASQKVLNQNLTEAAFFIHSMRNEPFGITPVQAIEKGCIPVVHDSGGQKEVVPFKELRYKNIAEATRILKDLSARDETSLEELLTKLQSHIRGFSSANFRTDFDLILSEVI